MVGAPPNIPPPLCVWSMEGRGVVSTDIDVDEVSRVAGADSTDVFLLQLGDTLGDVTIIS